MSELTQVGGIPHEFIYNDKVYKISLLTQKIKGEFEQRQFARSIEAARQLKPLMTKSEYVSYLNQLNDNFTSGEYGFDSSKGIAILQNKKAIITLCCLLFDVEEDQMWKMMKTHEEEIAAKLKVVLKESLGIAEETIEPAAEDDIIKKD